jgi:hypothetical protein
MQRDVRFIRCVGMVLGLAAAFVLFLPGIATAQGVSAAIDADKGWAYSNAYFEAGQSFTVSTSGTWTVDYRLWPAVGANGYDDSTDDKIYKGCKYVDGLPYGRLLGRIGDGGPVFSVGDGGTFRADATGPLNLRINDVDRCLVDNSGYVQVSVS